MPEHTLKSIAEWLESDSPPDQETARVLFEEVIPAAMDAEVASLHLESTRLLRLAHALSGLGEKALSEAVSSVTGLTAVPPSCAMCNDAKPVYSYGTYKLCCLYEREDDKLKRPELAVVPAEQAFNQPVAVSQAQLMEQVSDKEPPDWCPLR